MEQTEKCGRGRRVFQRRVGERREAERRGQTRTMTAGRWSPSNGSGDLAHALPRTATIAGSAWTNCFTSAPQQNSSLCCYFFNFILLLHFFQLDRYSHQVEIKRTSTPFLSVFLSVAFPRDHITNAMVKSLLITAARTFLSVLATKYVQNTPHLQQTYKTKKRKGERGRVEEGREEGRQIVTA